MDSFTQRTYLSTAMKTMAPSEHLSVVAGLSLEGRVALQGARAMQQLIQNAFATSTPARQ